MLKYDLQTDLLLSASTSILSSFASQSQASVGARVSTRLLLPYATPDRPRVTATLAETLGRHSPRTDAEARDLLVLGEDLVARGSVRVCDACNSVSHTRYRHHAAAGRPGAAVHWLLRGIECWHVLRASREDAEGLPHSPLLVQLAGMCGRRFVTVCTETARALLSEAANATGEALVHYHAVAREILEAIAQGPGDMSDLVARDPSVVLLQHIFDIAEATAANKSDVVAQNIVACLDETVDSEGDGVVSILAPPSMRPHFLQIALEILETEEEEEAGGTMEDASGAAAADGGASGSCSFQVGGIHALMARFTQLTFSSTMTPGAIHDASMGKKRHAAQEGSNLLPFDEQCLRRALCKGLMRAFLAENAERKQVSDVSSGRSGFDEGSVEREVAMMLLPSM